MSKERFLLYMLAGIFTFQARMFGFGIYYCANNGGIKECPEIGKRYEQTFNVMAGHNIGFTWVNAHKRKISRSHPTL